MAHLGWGSQGGCWMTGVVACYKTENGKRQGIIKRVADRGTGHSAPENLMAR